MAKKVKFPLDMGNEVYVRTLEELKENYDTEKVTEYFLEGRLLTWLNDRYYEEEAAAVGELAESGDKENLAAKLGKIFGIEIQNDVDVENLEIRREKLDKLRQITADDEILDNADSVAFSQEELGDLLDEEKEVIYLCGDKFRIPLGVKNVKYIGVNNPTVTISGKGEIDLEASGIVVEKCGFSEDTKVRFAVKKENEEIISQADEIMLADLIGDEVSTDNESVDDEYEDAEFEATDEYANAEFEEINQAPKNADDPYQKAIDELHNFAKYDQFVIQDFNDNPKSSTEVAANFINYFANKVSHVMTPDVIFNKVGPNELRNKDMIILRGGFVNYSLKAKNAQAFNEIPLRCIIHQGSLLSETIQHYNGILPCNDDAKTAILSGSIFSADKRRFINGIYSANGRISNITIMVSPTNWDEFVTRYMIQTVALVGCKEPLSNQMLNRLTMGSIVSGNICVMYQLNMEKLIIDLLQANDLSIKNAWKKFGRYISNDIFTIFLPAIVYSVSKEEIRYVLSMVADDEQQFEKFCHNLFMPFSATLTHAGNSK